LAFLARAQRQSLGLISTKVFFVFYSTPTQCSVQPLYSFYGHDSCKRGV